MKSNNIVVIVGALAIVGAFGWYMYLQSSKSYVDEKGQKYERTLQRGLPKDLATQGNQKGTDAKKEAPKPVDSKATQATPPTKADGAQPQTP